MTAETNDDDEFIIVHWNDLPRLRFSGIDERWLWRTGGWTLVHDGWSKSSLEILPTMNQDPNWEDPIKIRDTVSWATNPIHPNKYKVLGVTDRYAWVQRIDPDGQTGGIPPISVPLKQLTKEKEE